MVTCKLIKGYRFPEHSVTVASKQEDDSPEVTYRTMMKPSNVKNNTWDIAHDIGNTSLDREIGYVEGRFSEEVEKVHGDRFKDKSFLETFEVTGVALSTL
jgi:hypothetical protein